jgi:hypothetical protein
MNTRKHRERIGEIARRVGEDLETAAIEVLQKMTEKEITQTTENNRMPYFLEKGLILAVVANGRIDRQWNAEALKPHVRRLRKIERRYA